MYKKTKNLEYALLVTDLNKVIALELNNTGQIIARSGLLLDEEEGIIEEVYDLKEDQIPYTIKNKIIKNNFLTREELKKQRYLLREIDNIYKEKNKEKLEYLYQEIYKKDNLILDEKYLKLRQDIENNYSEQYNELYEIIRLTHIKK